MKNLKIRTKLLATLGSVILMATLVVVFLLTQLVHTATNVSGLYKGPFQNVNDVWTIRRNLIDVQRIINDLIISDTAMAQNYPAFEQQANVDVQAITEALQELETEIQNADAQQLFAEMDQLVAKGEEVRAQLMPLLRTGRVNDAYLLNSGTYMPIVQEINNKAIELFDLLQQDAQDYVTQASGRATTSFWVGVALLTAGILYGLYMTHKLNQLVATPLVQITAAANEMRQGNMGASSMITYEARDEVGQLAQCMRGTMNTLNDYIREISDTLVCIASGDLTMPGDQISDFLGDFSKIKESLVLILKRFNATLVEINHTSQEVELGANQISDAAQNLAAGASEQAGTLETLSDTISDISNKVSENAAVAVRAKDQSLDTGRQVQVCKQQMEGMMGAMRDIHEASEEIGKIIKAIEDIAFQTNILALNAAVEAARAGAAGKGFAVVADEVRSLAGKSAEASKSTAQLIERSAAAVDNGLTLAQQTASALLEVVTQTEASETLIDKIAVHSQEQATAINRISTGVSQISDVVSSNSATSEETAATSVVLSQQATRLKMLINRFKLFEGVNKSAANS